MNIAQNITMLTKLKIKSIVFYLKDKDVSDKLNKLLI